MSDRGMNALPAMFDAATAAVSNLSSAQRVAYRPLMSRIPAASPASHAVPFVATTFISIMTPASLMPSSVRPGRHR